MEKKINKSVHLHKSIKLNSKSKIITGNIFSKTNLVKVKSGSSIKGKINLKK
tara:strand:- start:375 stop:530 length:156 start_codon:yes stop_codon:yes gene_type:complete